MRAGAAGSRRTPRIIAEPCVGTWEVPCVDECPVQAIFPREDPPPQWNKYVQINLEYYKR